MDQITQLTGVEPNFSGEINPALLENGKFYSFADILDVGLVDEEVVFVRTYGFWSDAKSEASDELRENGAQNNQPSNSSDSDTTVSGTIVTTPDQVFKIDAGVLAADMTVAIEEPDFAQKLYTFCVKTDDPNLADFFCEGQARPVFTIAAYSFPQFQEQTTGPLYDPELESTITTYDDTIYTFSHMNGDVPDQIQGRADEYFKTVRDSFVYLR